LCGFLLQSNSIISTKNKVFQQIPQLKNFPVLSLHGKVPQEKRIGVFDKYYELKNGILLCSDVASRGIDIPDVDIVIQYDAPKDYTSFVHRCGRTARIGKTGLALALLLPNEETYIEFLGLKKIPLMEFTFGENGNEEEAANIIKDKNGKPLQLLNFVKKKILGNRELYEKSIKAFVSFIRHYKAHQLSYIFRFKEINLRSLAESFCLLKLPKMPELRNLKIDFTETNVDINSIKYAQKTKEKQRQEKLKKQKISNPSQDQSQKTENKLATTSASWSKTSEKKAEKQKRREKRKAKRDHQKKVKEPETLLGQKRKSDEMEENNEAADENSNEHVTENENENEGEQDANQENNGDTTGSKRKKNKKHKKKNKKRKLNQSVEKTSL